jgi:hypothetical protein
MDGRRTDEALTELDRLALEGIEREIRDVLSARPSPALLARVREAQARQARPARRWWMPWFVVAGAVATAALAVVIVPRLYRLPHAAPDASRAKVTSAAPAPYGSIAGAAPASRAANMARAAVKPSASSRPRHTRTVAPEVLVPPGQLGAIREFVEAFEASPLVAQPLQLHVGSIPTAPRLSEIVVSPLVLDWSAVFLDESRTVDRGGNR